MELVERVRLAFRPGQAVKNVNDGVVYVVDRAEFLLDVAADATPDTYKVAWRVSGPDGVIRQFYSSALVAVDAVAEGSGRGCCGGGCTNATPDANPVVEDILDSLLSSAEVVVMDFASKLLQFADEVVTGAQPTDASDAAASDTRCCGGNCDSGICS